MTEQKSISEGLENWLNDAMKDARKRTFTQMFPENLLSTMLDQKLVRILVEGTIGSSQMSKFAVDTEHYAGRVREISDYGVLSDNLSKQFLVMLKDASRVAEHKDTIGVSDLFLTIIKGFPELFNKYGITLEIVTAKLPSVEKKIETYSPKIDQKRSEREVSDSPHEKSIEQAKSNTPQLDIFGVDFTKKAADNLLDPTIGRDEETRQIIKILSRRTKNTPILVGDPGVGKSKIIEGIAQRIVSGDVPKSLKGRKLISLDMTALIAGANMRGQFEERLQKVLQEVEDSAGLILLFINEIHMINANDSSAGDVIKPALARGTIRLIGSSTTDDYRHHIESDSALMRQFQKVAIDEPTKDEAVTILRGVAQKFEEYHEVQISDDALVAAVDMSAKYVNDRVLPDKALDLIDEAGAKLRIELDSSPVVIDQKQRILDRLKVEEIALLRGADVDLVEDHEEDEEESEEVAEKVATGNEAIKARARDAAERKNMLNSLNLSSNFESMLPKEIVGKLQEIRARKATIEDELITLRTQWESEQKNLKQATKLRAQLKEAMKIANEKTQTNEFEEASKIEFEEIPVIKEQLEKLEDLLSNPLVSEKVSEGEVAKVVESWTGIPVGKLLAGEAQKLIKMEEIIGAKVIGQDNAIVAISDAVRRSRAGVNDPNKPTGSFMFAGPSGVGKTYLAENLAEFLFDDKSAMIRIDMSEYGEKHASAKLIGAPPGYVGYEAGGILTEAVRKKPYSVVLFDEVEKAHPETFDLMLQILDSGHISDSQGRVIDFKNTIIVLTSNLGSGALIDNELTDEEKDDFVMGAIKGHFRPEFLNRLDEIVIFNPFSLDDLVRIVDTELKKFEKRLAAKTYGFSISKTAREWLAENGYEPAYGARPLKRLIQKELGDRASKLILSGEIEDDGTIVVATSRDKKTLTMKAK